ncbi:futalosine hydrolase [Paenibacillus sp. y28]|uniref:futalosine hydrolase n=1 Tax=Paenibacillus sp. y28 TaxID=3129110 RepID=UPI0030187AAB
MNHPEASPVRVLVMTAVQAEKDAVVRGLGSTRHIDVALAGVGAAAAAANTMAALCSGSYDLVISAGIGGGFTGRAEVGSLVVANEIIAADLGAETPEGYCSVDELGFGSARVPAESGLSRRWTEALREAGLQVESGPILTVTTVTGTAETAARLAARVPGARSEAMEGYGVAIAAQLRGVPCLELRAISNAVGPRDKSAWRIQDALTVLEAASAILPEVLN